MKKIFTSILGVMALSLALSAAPVFAIGTNGSFEIGTDPGSFTTLSSLDTTSITGWSVDSGSIDYIGTLWPASNGVRSLDLNGLAAGSISQTLPTVVGATYNITFDLSGNPDSSTDSSLASPSNKQMSVSATGASPQSFNYDTSVEGNSLSSMMWKQKSYSFVATATSTTLAFTSTIAGSFGPALDNVSITETLPNPTPTNSTVHIFKFIDGVQATTVSANSVNFPMFTSTFNAPFTLGPLGWATGDIPYEASTSPMTLGSSYSANENLDTSLVGASCDATNQYSLIGYGVGDTLLQAEQATPSMTTPSFTNLQGDKYIIVQNHLCPPIQTLKVHVLKYLDGAKADVTSASGYQFPMIATWQTSNLNGGVSTSGNYVLGNNFGGAPDLYGADTVLMNAPANYTTSEVTDSSSQVVSSMNQCLPGKYLLNGYRTSGTSFAVAATGSLLAVAPVFTGLTNDQYVIVDNSKCPTTSTISGMKYNDLNRNGQKDVGEPGLAGWVIRLMSGNTVLATTTTDASGNYTFSNIIPGTYKLREVHQNGWKRISKNPKPIVITAGSVVTGVDFGNAVKRRGENEDTNKDDSRDDQSGNYYANHDISNYRNDQGKKDHQQSDNNKDD